MSILMASLIMLCHIIYAQSDITSLINKALENHVDYLEQFETKTYITPYYIDVSTFPQNYVLPSYLKEKDINLIEGTKRKSFREEKHVLRINIIDVEQDCISIQITSFVLKTKHGTIYAGRYEGLTTKLVWSKDSSKDEYKLMSITH